MLSYVCICMQRRRPRQAKAGACPTGAGAACMSAPSPPDEDFSPQTRPPFPACFQVTHPEILLFVGDFRLTAPSVFQHALSSCRPSGSRYCQRRQYRCHPCDDASNAHWFVRACAYTVGASPPLGRPVPASRSHPSRVPHRHVVRSEDAPTGGVESESADRVCWQERIA